MRGKIDLGGNLCGFAVVRAGSDGTKTTVIGGLSEREARKILADFRRTSPDPGSYDIGRPQSPARSKRRGRLGTLACGR